MTELLLIALMMYGAYELLIWFKNDKRALCFDTTQTNWETEVEKTVENWYDKGE